MKPVTGKKARVLSAGRRGSLVFLQLQSDLVLSVFRQDYEVILSVVSLHQDHCVTLSHAGVVSGRVSQGHTVASS